MTRSYDTWALRLNAAIAARPGAVVAPWADEEALVRELLVAFATEAAAMVGALGRHLERVQVEGNDRADVIEDVIEKMWPHRSFSLLEFRYTLPSGREPGLRFQVELDGAPPSIEVQLFEDRRRWREDPASRAERTIAVRFELQEGQIRWRPASDQAPAFANCTDWTGALGETLALPFRHLYDPRARAC